MVPNPQVLKEMKNLSHWLFDEVAPATEGSLMKRLARKYATDQMMSGYGRNALYMGANNVNDRVKVQIQRELKGLPIEEVRKRFFRCVELKPDLAYSFVEDDPDLKTEYVYWLRGARGKRMCEELFRSKKDFYFHPEVITECKTSPQKIAQYGEYTVLVSDTDTWIPLEASVTGCEIDPWITRSDLMDMDIPESLTKTRFQRYTNDQLIRETANCFGMDALVDASVALEVDLAGASKSFEESIIDLYEYDKQIHVMFKRESRTSEDLAVIKEAIAHAKVSIAHLKSNRSISEKLIEGFISKCKVVFPAAGAVGGWMFGVKLEKQNLLEVGDAVYTAFTGLIGGYAVIQGISNAAHMKLPRDENIPILKGELDDAIKNGCDGPKAKRLYQRMLGALEEIKNQYENLYEIVKRELKSGQSFNLQSFQFN